MKKRLKQDQKQRIGWGALAFAVVLLLTSACEKERPPWAEESYPDYTSLIEPFTLVSLELKNANSDAIVTFDSLAAAVRSKYPEAEPTIEGENPFPGLIPRHRTYGWLSSWERIEHRSNLPVIWTTIQMREPTIFYITATGAIKVEKPPKFSELLDGFISIGAKQSPSRESIKRSKPD